MLPAGCCPRAPFHGERWWAEVSALQPMGAGLELAPVPHRAFGSFTTACSGTYFSSLWLLL